MLNQMIARYPGICQIVGGERFRSDISVLSGLQAANQNPRDFVDAVYDDRKLNAKHLMAAMSFPIFAPGAADRLASHLERDVQMLLPALQLQRLRTVFNSKFFAKHREQWIDTVHEIAVASTLLSFYDQSTLELEKAIPGTGNNSDTYGLRHGKPARIDATVIHENWPPVSQPDNLHTTYTRSTMDAQEMDDVLAMNPGEVITFAQLPTNPATHTDSPLSTKVWRALQCKRRQCEPGCVNLIAIGLPRPFIDDSGTEDAVLGVPHVIVDCDTDQAFCVRHGTGPFVPEMYSTDIATCVDSFRIMSGVWLTRWNAGDPLSKVLANPNATTTLIAQDATNLAAAGTSRAMWQ